MSMHTITRGAALVASRIPAFVAGSICVACAGAILFEDVLKQGASIEINHLLTAGILSIALLAGHLRSEAWRERRRTAALGFLTLFVAATALVVYLSTGKQAEHTFQSQAEADFAAEERTRIRPLLAAAEQMMSDTAKKIKKECVDGKASKTACDGLRSTHGIYEGAVNGHKTNLDKLGAPKPVAPEAESFANIAAVFGYDKAKVKAGAILVVPFIRTILFELGGLWCLGYAFRPVGRSATPDAPTLEQRMTAFETAHPVGQIIVRRGEATPDDPAGRSGGPKLPAPKKPKGPAPDGRTETAISQLKQIAITGRIDGATEGLEGRVLNFLRSELSAGRSIPSQASTVARFKAEGLARSTLSDWYGKWEASGALPERTQVGRCKVLAPAGN